MKARSLIILFAVSLIFFAGILYLNSFRPYSFDLLLVEKPPGGVTFKPGRWWMEGYGSICAEVRKKTLRRIRLCIIDQSPRSGSTAYAFTGGLSGEVFILKPAGTDYWGLERAERWQGDPKDFFLQAIKGLPPAN